MRILIVDDDIAQVESLCLVLQQFKYITYSALNLDAAKLIAETHKPATIILDLMMPSGSKKLLEWLQTDPNMCGVKIIIVTGMTINEALRKEYNIPAEVQMIQKPYTIHTLLKAIGGT